PIRFSNRQDACSSTTNVPPQTLSAFPYLPATIISTVVNPVAQRKRLNQPDAHRRVGDYKLLQLRSIKHERANRTRCPYRSRTWAAGKGGVLAKKGSLTVLTGNHLAVACHFHFPG